MSSVVAGVGFDRIPAPGLLVELDGTVHAANAAMCTLLGRSAADLIGRPIGELFRGGERIVLAPGETHELQLDVGGARRTLQCAVSALDTGERVVLQVFGVDISARTAAEERSLGIIAGGIAHEFNNLLVGVLTEASAAREDRSLPTATLDALDRIQISSQRMAQLTRLMLAYAGRGQYTAVSLDPDEVIVELRDALVRRVGDAIVLEISGGSGGVVIEADAQMLRQVILDLVANGAESGATRVAIATRIIRAQNAPWWQLEVSDDGAGIDGPTISRIFEPFFTTKPDRHGLGLSAVHGIVRRIGGDIEVDSTPGQGARFRVRVPVVAGVPAAPRRINEARVPIAKLTGITVLLADDQPAVRATICRLLERRGAQVVLAVDGLQAQTLLGEHTFGLMILDVSMPGRGGYEVLAAARILQPGVPVMLMSGYTYRARGEGTVDPDAFLEKPFTAAALDAAIDEVMRTP